MITYPFSFKAAILEQVGKPLVIDEIEFQGPLQEGQILVKLYYSGICGKQTDEMDGKAPDPFMPHLLGHEGGAEVCDVGPGVTKVKTNDKVVLHWRKGSGIHSATPLYVRKGTKERINAGWVTTFNEYAIVSENRVTPIPADADLKIAALFGCVVTTGVGIILNDAKVTQEDVVLIVGCGGVGLCAVQAASLAHPRKLIAVDVNPKALAMAKDFGATDIINSSQENFLDAVMKITDEQGANKVIVCIGKLEVIEASVEATSIPGDCFIAGVPPKEAYVKINPWKVMHERNIHGTLGGKTYPDRDIPAYFELYKQGKLKLDQLISYEGNFESLNDAIACMRGDAPGRCVVKFI